MKSMSNKMNNTIKAFLATWASIRITGIATTNLMTIIMFIFYIYIFTRIADRKRIEVEKPLQQSMEKIVSILFTILFLCGDVEQIWNGLENNLFRSVILCVTGVGLYLIFEMAISILIIETSKWKVTGATWNLFFPMLSGIICFICWIPYLLKNYPGVMTIDSMNQFAQVIGVYADSNHHPWVHTQIMKFWYQVGLLFTDNISIAISFYTIFQMLFMAFCVSYLLGILNRFHIKKWILVMILFFYAGIPYNAIYAVTIWKDTMFAGGVLLYVVTLLRLLQWLKQKDGSVSKVRKRSELFNFIMMIVSGIMMSLFRTNGWYAFLITIPFVIFIFRKHWKIVALLQLFILITVVIIKGPVMEANHVIQPDLVESLSIPVQQISRVIVLKRSLTEEQSVFLNHILDTTKIQEWYNPHVSDGFKRLVRAGDEAYLEAHFIEFLKVYLQIGLRYPADYLIAFRDQSIGYWFPTQEGIIAGDEGVIVNEFGVVNLPVISGPIVIKINEIGLKLKDMIPGYGILWSMGALFWLMILAIGIIVIRGDHTMLLLYVPSFAIFLTLVIATPVAKEFRYAYAYIYCIPIYLLVPFMNQTRN